MKSKRHRSADDQHPDLTATFANAEVFDTKVKSLTFIPARFRLSSRSWNALPWAIVAAVDALGLLEEIKTARSDRSLRRPWRRKLSNRCFDRPVVRPCGRAGEETGGGSG